MIIIFDLNIIPSLTNIQHAYKQYLHYSHGTSYYILKTFLYFLLGLHQLKLKGRLDV